MHACRKDTVLRAVTEHLHDFVASNGAGMLEALVVEESQPERTEECLRRLRAKLDERKKRLDELIDTLTPALAPALEPKIVALRREVERIEVQIDQLEDARMSRAQAERLVRDVVDDLATMAKVIDEATPAEQRQVVCGLAHEIVLDPAAATGELVLRAIPDVGAMRNEKSPRSHDRGLSALMAGARHPAPETRTPDHIARKPFAIPHLRKAA